MSYQPKNPNGQATSANSSPVVIASDQSALPITDNGGSITVDGTVELGATTLAALETINVGNFPATQPVSLASVPTHAVTLTSTTITGTVAVTDNAGSLTVDAPVGTPAFVRLSNGTAAVDTLPVSLASVPSHAVTNAGTFAVQAAQSGTYTVGLSAAQTLATVTTVGTVTNLSQLGGVAINMNTGVRATGTQRVTIATDDIVQVKNAPDATATYSPSNATTTAYAASLIAKASAGNLYAITGYNSKTTAQFIQVHNSATLPANGVAPALLFIVPAASNFSFDLASWGRYFSAGITICNSSTGPTKTIGAADCWFDIQYK